MSLFSEISSAAAVVMAGGTLWVALMRRKPEARNLNAQAQQYEAQAKATATATDAATKVAEAQFQDMVIRFGVATGDDLEQIRGNYRDLESRYQVLEQDNRRLTRRVDELEARERGVLAWWREHVAWERIVMRMARQQGPFPNPPPIPAMLEHD